MSTLLARNAKGPTTLTALATLEAAGAYQTAPLAAACVALPAGWDQATISFVYTAGTTGGQMAVKVYFVSGGPTPTIAQVMAPDSTYNGFAGPVGTSNWSISVDCRGTTKIGIAAAEVGVAGTPGTFSSTVTFG